MIGLDNTTALEIITLEKALEDECKCEAYHERTQTVCSGEVTHAFKASCLETEIRLACANSATYAVTSFSRGAVCRSCGRPTTECWTLIPI